MEVMPKINGNLLENMLFKVNYYYVLTFLIVSLVKLLVIVYDILTFPVYLLAQKPWQRREKASAIRSQQIDPEDPLSPWVQSVVAPKHFIDSCHTVDEAIKKSIDYNGHENNCMAYREIVDEEVHHLNGKPITKLVQTDYKWVTYGQFDDRVSRIGRGLILNGVKPKDIVMIFADTSIDWYTCAQAILRMGASVGTLYSSLNDEGIVHGLNETEVTHVITSRQLLPKLLKLNKQIPRMSTVIYFDNRVASNKTNNDEDNAIRDECNARTVRLVPLRELESAGQQASANGITFATPKPEDIAVVLYTSGSTGVPKGVKITHKNFLKAIYSYKQLFNSLLESRDQQLYIGYLPLAHILELVTESIMFIVGIRIGYSTPNTLTDTSTAVRPGDRGDASLLQPTFMVAVPLVLDRIRKGIADKINRKGLIARKVFEFFVDYKTFWSEQGFDTPIMNRVLCAKFQAVVGGRLSIIFAGGAPLSQDTQKAIKSCLNIRLLQGYGSTETSMVGCIMDMDDTTFGRVGAPLIDTKVTLINWEEGGYRNTDRPNPRGEMVISSDAVSHGYYKLEAATEEAYYKDSDGNTWFKTGDIAEVFPNGTFKIIDRKKDLIKLAQGEYVSLGKIEAELKCNPFVDNICVYGHLYHSYLVALVVPNQLALTKLARRLKVDYISYGELCSDKKIVAYLTAQIKKHCASAKLNKYETPMTVNLVPEEWTPDTGLVTAAMKLKRKNIVTKYQRCIDAMYQISDNNNS
ncbi:fatty acid CoA ligase Acsl3-like [Oppia nitens]|uniref:fatty acid CoA ligase Acsl3-like n=1 Tax=Oppia nitens TaxID=1686743 RepID=UPI0023DBF1A2|nr:fatty acid CoA ligase Acsl3-like [Oppia nitens]